MQIHRSNERGRADHGWLQSRFSFSFAEYYNPTRMGFGALRVINDDIIAPLSGFGMHPHRDMEIITIVLSGALEHRDSEGNHGIIHAGDIQYMSAASGIRHSEFNPSDSEPVSLFQIWIHPEKKGGTPHYDQRRLEGLEEPGVWHLLVTPQAHEKAITIAQDATIRMALIPAGTALPWPPLAPDQGRLILVISGTLTIGDATLNARDEARLDTVPDNTLQALSDVQLLSFDVPMHA